MDHLAQNDIVGNEPLNDVSLSFSEQESAAVLKAANKLAEVVELADERDLSLAAPHLRHYEQRWEGDTYTADITELSPAAQAVVAACENLLLTLESVGNGFSSIESMYESLHLGVPPHFDPPEFDFLYELLKRLV